LKYPGQNIIAFSVNLMTANIPRRSVRSASVVIFLLISFALFSQQAEIKGLVVDAKDYSPLPGVNIVLDSINGAATDEEGRYRLEVQPGAHTIAFRYIGYKINYQQISVKAGESANLDIKLQPLLIQLNTAVVSASRYEQRLSDVTVSMEVLKPEFIRQQNVFQLDEALRLLPGVDVMDGQANIRGGGGYSYGAGSRVMMLVDDLPMLTGDVNDVKWNFIPVELTGQVEVIKGASSALYGSSALNGVINMRTATPGETPETNVNVSAGFYTDPAREELSWWWDGVPFFGGIKVSHLRKAGPFDITLGINGFGDEGYRTDNYQRYGRFTGSLRYNSPRIKGLSTGLRTSIHFQKSSDFLLWTDADSGAFIQSEASVSSTDAFRFNADPYVIYFDKNKGKHNLLTRYFTVNNSFPDDPDKNNGSDYFYGEYQYQRAFHEKTHLAAGIVSSYTIGTSSLYGDHTGSTFALYAQADQRFLGKLSASLGLRWEYFRLDSDAGSKPVIRAGINYEAARNTYLRASFGQGYRYPSMAEKYTATSVGSLNIFPNPGLEPETGWSAEAGIRKGFRFGQWNGFADLAGFWTEYQDMMEFTFGIYLSDSNQVPTLDNLGFKSLNTGAARIAGIDLSVEGNGRIGKVLMTYFAGYTWMDPVDLSSDTLENDMLKYRYKHSAKADAGMVFGQFNTGLTLVYQSFMERIDAAFEEAILGQEIFPGLKEYRQENDKGAVVLDFRFGWQATPSSSISLFVKNIFNKEYMGRPGDIQPPRNISLQYVLKLN